ncbi:MAG: helix-turn-helix transcriptional regulator [Hyphomicrobiaceae bacterium]|nr:helix-turn-helix transcriptional regulator [Hyphomicrobiaceae bacterium]
MKEQIGIRIKALRKDRGLTQAQLAERTDRSLDTISAIERGVNYPGIDTALAIAGVFGVSLPELVEFDPKITSSRRAEMLAEISVDLRKLTDKELAKAAEIVRALAG